MAAFFAKTWFLWYACAVVIITRWFHVAGSDIEPEVQVHHPADAKTAEKQPGVEGNLCRGVHLY
jgi:hypothetical protein